ncbi:DUF2085 domain-containing protein [Natronorubrum sp. JWXQ-INN-674]|uniref:DUF2085 domain-containing protein n=1 Tax=Natronorubrum halalkaliphilum TaxID=2691917 RepID=A0A6B0VIG0_9EURY|nr:DUF2085 domain-containing protein [Natronorubrum halalkaliphilum]MXV61641.1 DUF2085 domain-containing protein [Natronorubrum halalkaliphilum]
MQIDRTELRKGLARTCPYLLSHHLPSERDRCYSPTVFGRRIHLCARCTGIYPGILVALVASMFASGLAHSSTAALFVVLAFPLPALVDWTITTFTERSGSNGVRTMTGVLLGYGYGVGLSQLFLAADFRIAAVGIVYGVTAGILIYTSQRNQSPYE